MTNKKFKMAAMSLALTACVAASPLAANADAPENASDAQPAAVQHESEPEAAPAAESVSEPAAEEEEAAEPSSAEPQEEPVVVVELPSEEAPAETADAQSEAAEDETASEEASSTADISEAAAQPAIASGEITNAAAVENPYGISTLMPGADDLRAVSRGTAMIAGNDNVIYGTLDTAIDHAESGDTIKMIEDETCSGIILDNKDLTIEGITNMVTEKDEQGNTTIKEVKPKLTFINEGIYLKNSKLTLKNLDVDMTGITSTPNHADGLTWMGICLNQKSDLTLDNTDLVMDSCDYDSASADKGSDGIYMAGNEGNSLNVTNKSHLTIRNYHNAIAWNGTKENSKSKYEINVTGDSSLTLDHNGAGIVGMESLDVLVDNSTLNITNCTGRSGINGANVKIVNGSNANVSDNHEGYGIHANDLLVEDSTLTTNNNGYGGIRITGKGQFTNSTVTVTGTEAKGNASIEITPGRDEHGDPKLIGSLDVKNSTLNVSNNNATGITCRNRYGLSTSLTIDDASRVTIRNNHATPANRYNTKGDIGGGLRIEEGSTAVLGRNTIINNNHADKAGDDIFIMPGGSLTFSVYNGTGGGDLLDDCGDKISGWFMDAEGNRWDFHGEQNYVQDVLDGKITLPEGVTLVDNGDGTYTITVAADAAAGMALKAAHAEAPAPDPDDPTPVPPDEPTPIIPEENSPVLPENPELPPVQDARADAETPVLPENPVLPAVQDAHALPQTGTSLFAALAMALSGFALMAAGAFASLTGKNARH